MMIRNRLQFEWVKKPKWIQHSTSLIHKGWLTRFVVMISLKLSQQARKEVGAMKGELLLCWYFGAERFKIVYRFESAGFLKADACVKWFFSASQTVVLLVDFRCTGFRQDCGRSPWSDHINIQNPPVLFGMLNHMSVIVYNLEHHYMY